MILDEKLVILKKAITSYTFEIVFKIRCYLTKSSDTDLCKFEAGLEINKNYYIELLKPFTKNTNLPKIIKKINYIKKTVKLFDYHIF